MVTDPHDRLGAAAIQGESNSIPVPQGAFDRDLVTEGEVHWATTDDDVVVISGEWDSLRDEAGLDVFATSTITDRTLDIPAEAFEEWDDVGGGDTLHFVTTDELEAKRQALVVPAAQARELELLEE